MRAEAGTFWSGLVEVFIVDRVDRLVDSYGVRIYSGLMVFAKLHVSTSHLS